MSRCKIALIGEVSSGKTTLGNYLRTNQFVEESCTVGVAFHSFKLDDKNFEIWDTSGQEKFSSLTTVYYRNASIILLVFDANNIRFEDKLKYYLDETKLKVESSKNYRIIIICNKIDLVSETQLANLKKRIDKIIIETNSSECVAGYFEISCKKKIGRNDLLSKIIEIRSEQIGIETEYSIFDKKNKDQYRNVIVLDYNEETKKSSTSSCCFIS